MSSNFDRVLSPIEDVDKYLDLIGKRFNKVTVVELLGRDKRHNVIYKCVCDCGNYLTRARSGLKVTNSCRKCACAKRGFETRKYENLRNWKSAYHSWRGMKSRCLSEKDTHYKYYGALGIGICEEWLDSENGFLNFFNDMGERPKGETLDRIDAHGNYCKENCRWADLTTQAYNTKRDHLNKSGRIGVRIEERVSGVKYIAKISYRNKTYHLGSFDSFEEACKAREEAELKYYGVTK